MSTPSSAAGRQLKVATSSPVSYASIDGIDGLSYGNSAKPKIDVTAISDSASRTVADIPPIQTLSFTLHYDPDDTQHAALRANYEGAGTNIYFEDNMNNTGAYVRRFVGYVEQWDETASKGASNQVNVVISIDGAIQSIP